MMADVTASSIRGIDEVEKENFSESMLATRNRQNMCYVCGGFLSLPLHLTQNYSLFFLPHAQINQC